MNDDDTEDQTEGQTADQATPLAIYIGNECIFNPDDFDEHGARRKRRTETKDAMPIAAVVERYRP
jgi:hypothetical protein